MFDVISDHPVNCNRIVEKLTQLYLECQRRFWLLYINNINYFDLPSFDYTKGVISVGPGGIADGLKGKSSGHYSCTTLPHIIALLFLGGGTIIVSGESSSRKDRVPNSVRLFVCPFVRTNFFQINKTGTRVVKRFMAEQG